MSDNLITIGKIVAPHGVRGDVRVIPLTDFPERFRTLKSICLDDGNKLVVEGVKYHNQFVLLKIKGLDNMSAVETLRGKLIKVTREELVVLPKGQYYQFQILGLQVYNEAGDCLGRITDILQTGSNDVYVADKAGEKPLLIPALKQVVLQIDIDAGKMIVKLQEELEEE